MTGFMMLKKTYKKNSNFRVVLLLQKSTLTSSAFRYCSDGYWIELIITLLITFLSLVLFLL